MDAPLPSVDTAQVDQGLFLAHGRLQVWPHDALLCVLAAGPFNVEMVSVLTRAIQQLHWRPPPAYLTVVRWQHSMLASPDTLAAYEKLLRHGSFPQPLSSLWLADDDVEGVRLMRPRWEAVYAAVGRPLEIFDRENRLLARADALLAAASAHTVPQPAAAHPCHAP